MQTISKIKKIKLSDILSCLLIFAIVTGLLIGFRCFYNLGYGKIVPGILGIPQLFWNGFGAVSFYLFLTCSPKMQRESVSKSIRVLSSLFYGLCAYALLQESRLSALTLFALLPLLMLAYEYMTEHKTTVFFVLVLTLCLFADAAAASSLMLFLLLMLFLDSSKTLKQKFDGFIQTFFLYLLSLLIAGISAVPRFYEYFSASSDYSGFEPTYPLSNFFSRFFAGSLTSALFPQSRSIDLYFGLFFVLLLFLYFFNQSVAWKTRRNNLIFTLILLCAVEYSPLQYVFELFSVSGSSTIPYSFFLIFWCLKLSVESLGSLKKIKKLPLFIGMFAFMAFSAVALYGSRQNFHSVSLLTNGIFILLYAVCILYFCLKPNGQFTTLFLPCLLCLELFCNLFLTTNQNFIPDSFSLKNQFGDTSFETAETASSPYAEEYEDFAGQHADAQLTGTLVTLFDHVELTEEDRLAYDEYGILDFFEELNAICYKIGADSELFTPANLTFSFPDSDYYQITDQGNNVYNLYQYASCTDYSTTVVPFQLSAPETGVLVLYHNFSDRIFEFKMEQPDTVADGYLVFSPQPNISLNFQLNGYYLNEELYAQIPDMLTNYLELQYLDPDSHSMLPNYIGLGCTCIGILLFLLLYINRDKKVIIARLDAAKEALLTWGIWNRLSAFLYQNRVYLCAFLVPVMLYLLSMVLFSCIPFGSNSFYDQDGINSTLPTIMDYYYNLKNGNNIFSMNGGYGYCLYNAFPLGILEYPLTIFTPYQVAVLVLLLEAVSFGFCSFSVVYYLTHRLTAPKALKSDYRMLIPAFIYALNTYMLAMHGFVTWYYTFLMFPLLILAMDYLMYQKKWMMYTILLSLCICTNIQLALYICIFLITLFFTYNFNSLKDFLAKGIRFALCSVLAACNGFFSISNTLLATSDSMYKDADSIFPSLGFHTSFWEQWKQLMMLSESTAVNHDDGGINFYMSILVLFLILVYFFSRKYTLKEKLCRLIPACFLLLSFNGRVLSFIWNGFHYQSNVPNRQVFLFMFLCAVIAYDGLRALDSVSLKKYSVYGLILAAFFCLCQFISSGNTQTAFISTLTAVSVYWLFHVLYKRRLFGKVRYYKFLTLFLLLELCVNMYGTVSEYGLNTIAFTGAYEEQAKFNTDCLKLHENAYRVSIPGTFQLNPGSMYDAPSGSLFNSYVTAHQTNLNFHYGFASGVNYTVNNYNNTPLGLALSGTKYCLVPIYSSLALPDLTDYEFLGCYESNYIYRVPDTLSLGFYAPEGVLDLSESSGYVPVFWNDFVSMYTDEDAAPVYELHALTYDADLTLAANTYYFSDINHQPVSCEEADSIITEMAATTSSQVIRDLHLNIHIAPEKPGKIYLYMNEFVPLGELTAPTALSFAYPNPTPASPDSYYYVRFNEDTFDAFMAEASENQVEQIMIDDNRITGVTDYDCDGYTVLSLAYDQNWTAYIDGEEVEILDPYGSFMVIQTPSGKHTIELVYEPYGMKISLIISGVSFLITILLYLMWCKKRSGNHPHSAS